MLQIPTPKPAVSDGESIAARLQIIPLRHRTCIYRRSFFTGIAGCYLILVQLVYIRWRDSMQVRFIAIRVLMQPRSLLVNRQLFNKYFHSHHYYLGGPKIAGASNGYDYTNIHVRADPYINFIHPRFLRCSALVFNTVGDRTAQRKLRLVLLTC